MHRPAPTGERRLLLRAREAVARGQAMVEFALVLLPVLLIVVAIIQFGLLFGAQVTITNAAREGARVGTVYVYDNGHNRYWNDAAALRPDAGGDPRLDGLPGPRLAAFLRHRPTATARAPPPPARRRRTAT